MDVFSVIMLFLSAKLRIYGELSSFFSLIYEKHMIFWHFDSEYTLRNRKCTSILDVFLYSGVRKHHIQNRVFDKRQTAALFLIFCFGYVLQYVPFTSISIPCI